jgi:hypothetical protein
MRPFGSIIVKTIGFRAHSVPGSRLERAIPPAVSKLDEGVIDLFNCACMMTELGAAADLVTLMAKWHAGRSYHDFEEKRVVATHLKRMQSELERRHIMKGMRPPDLG